MNWIQDKVQGKVVAVAQLHYAGWLERMQDKTRIKEVQKIKKKEVNDFRIVSNSDWALLNINHDEMLIIREASFILMKQGFQLEIKKVR